MEGSHAQAAQSSWEPWDGPAILLVDLDAFFASVEQRDHPAWRGKPVIVGGDADKHGVVSTASYEARTFGVHSGMAASTARNLCPQAIWTRGHFDLYKKTSGQVMSILRDESPILQQVSIDEAFLDVSPTPINTEHPALIAQRIQARVAELGITCSIGLGTSKCVAKIASDMDKPQGLTVVYPGRELDFLSPLPVRALSGVGHAAEATLAKHGIFTLGDMAEAPESLLKSIYGKNGEAMRMRCLGIDEAPIARDAPTKSMSSETTVAQDLRSYEDIARVAEAMAFKVGRRLRRHGLAGHTVALRMRFSDRSLRSVQRRMPTRENNEHALLPYIHDMIYDLWQPGMAVRLIGVAVSGFEDDSAYQESLFDADTLAATSLGVTSPSSKRTASEGPLTGEEASEAGPDGALSGSARQSGLHARPTERPIRQTIGYEQGKQLSAACDEVKDRFGEGAVFYGRDLRVFNNNTGTAAKNPADYLNDAPTQTAENAARMRELDDGFAEEP